MGIKLLIRYKLVFCMFTCLFNYYTLNNKRTTTKCSKCQRCKNMVAPKILAAVYFSSKEEDGYKK